MVPNLATHKYLKKLLLNKLFVNNLSLTWFQWARKFVRKKLHISNILDLNFASTTF